MNTIESSKESQRQRIAVVGTGIAGMAAAWLLSKSHDLTVYEKDDRPGGHTNTVTVDGPHGPINVDTGFIVYNERNYPNLKALFEHLDVATRPSEMSFAASLDNCRFEYAGGASGFKAPPSAWFKPRLWSMLKDILRFYRQARDTLGHEKSEELTLGAYLEANRYGEAFVRDHLLPMGAAIWSTPANDILGFPLAAFVRFFANHGLLDLKDRPVWRSVVGGSRSYLEVLTASFADRIRLNTAVSSIRRLPDGVRIEDRQGGVASYDQVIIAAHADQALAMLADADPAEQRLLGKFRYERNLAILHTDEALMPRARSTWSSWNFMSRGRGEEQKVSVTYWMNRLQGLAPDMDLFVTLNPLVQPRTGRVLRSFMYEHPTYDRDAVRAQRLLWNLQGIRRTWFCGAYFGHGFHEDGLQSGLAVAEQLAGVERPWRLDEPNNRIICHATRRVSVGEEKAA